MSHLFSFSRYQRKCVIKFLLKHYLCHKLQDLSLIILLTNGWHGKKGKAELQKFEYLENKKIFLDEKKKTKKNFITI